jgi:hypothetical protein
MTNTANLRVKVDVNFPLISSLLYGRYFRFRSLHTKHSCVARALHFR